MSFWEIIVMAVALGTDALSVAVVLGVQQFSKKVIFKTSLTIGVFHIFMPLLGLYGGNFVKHIIQQHIFANGNLDYVFNLIGSGILAMLGVYMIIESFFDKEKEMSSLNLAGWGLLAVSLSVSIDAFSLGIGLGMMDCSTSLTVLTFGVTAGFMMALGLYIGSKIGNWLGEDAQILGGLALIILSLRFLGCI